MRCHISAFQEMGGACAEVLYDRMNTAVIGEDASGVVTYNASLLAHYGSAPRACQPYRAKTKGKVERPYSPHAQEKAPQNVRRMMAILRITDLP